jgi:hypothetical protein
MALPMEKTMSTWSWLAIGTTAFLGVPVVVGLGLSRILGQISQEVTDLLENEEWSGAPLTRALEDPEALRISASRRLTKRSA